MLASPMLPREMLGFLSNILSARNRGRNSEQFHKSLLAEKPQQESYYFSILTKEGSRSRNLFCVK